MVKCGKFYQERRYQESREVLYELNTVRDTKIYGINRSELSNCTNKYQQLRIPQKHSGNAKSKYWLYRDVLKNKTLVNDLFSRGKNWLVKTNADEEQTKRK